MAVLRKGMVPFMEIVTVTVKQEVWKLTLTQFDFSVYLRTIHLTVESFIYVGQKEHSGYD